MKKRILGVICGLTLACMTLSACGSDENDASAVMEETADTTVEDAEETPIEEVAEESEEEAEAQVEEESLERTGVTVRIGAMSGPTAMGMVKLMEDSENSLTANDYEFAELATEASAFVAPLTTGELDIAAIPSNLASNVYNKTEGGVKVLATNTLGVLYLLERGETVNEWADLKGKTIYATGAGAVPEYTIRYLLSSNGLDPDSDVQIQWCSDTTEALSYITQAEGAIAILPQPFVTAAKAQVEDLRVVFDLNEQWDLLDTGCNIVTGVVVVRTEFADEHPEAVQAFLKEYEESLNYSLDNTEEASQLIEKYGIVAKAAVAKAALPNCHLAFKSGDDMKQALEGFLTILYEQNPQAVGGNLPGDDFYYGAN